jgi:excisionase family DNA binding protein
MQLSLNTEDLRPLVQEVVREAIRELREANGTGVVLRAERAAPPPVPLLLTRKDAARLLAVCEKTVANLTDAGELPAVRVGRSVRYHREDLETWIAKSKTGDRE